ncbi:hypothetical protein Ac2012v2_000014 [Leucoagaricus gongylophorus]
MSDQDVHSLYNSPSESGSSKPGSTVGDKIKGVARVIHGVGEEVRGYTMSIVDNTLSIKAAGTDRNGAIIEKGKLEVERGLADLRVRGGTAASTSVEDQRISDSSSTYSANEVSGAGNAMRGSSR